MKKNYLRHLLILVLVSGGIYIYKLTKPNFSPQNTPSSISRLSTLEEQIGTYIKEKYSGY